MKAKNKFVVLGSDRANYCRYYQTKPQQLVGSLCPSCPDKKKCSATKPKKKLTEKDIDRLSSVPNRMGSTVFGEKKF